MKKRSAVSASGSGNDYPPSSRTLHPLIKEMCLSALARPCVRPPAHMPPRAPAARKPPHASRIHVVHANPVIVAVNPRARDLVELFQLASADLADLPIWNLDLGIVTENYNHSPDFWRSRAIKLSKRPSMTVTFHNFCEGRFFSAESINS